MFGLMLKHNRRIQVIARLVQGTEYLQEPKGRLIVMIEFYNIDFELFSMTGQVPHTEL